ncbi:MAG: type II toxin-antitoxin system VapC family toxin [Candidatus Thermoplasmatota archaeon]|nr:type II toxin-antitoxin system VapC family toxin [Candidatus Thermoplasmatota archaeon]
MIVLDTSYLISIARGEPDLGSKIGQLDEEDVFLTAIAHFEIFRSGAKMGQKEHSFFSNLFSAYEILPFDTESSRRASIIQEKLDKVGLKVNIMDVLIAGTSLGHGISRIATRDEDFKVIAKVEQLNVMDEL